MKEYSVTWKIDISAHTPLLAAQLAKEIQTDPNSIANCFEVAELCLDSPNNCRRTQVDLDKVKEEKENDHAN